jgi:hypothetical protein
MVVRSIPDGFQQMGRLALIPGMGTTMKGKDNFNLRHRGN